jgi:two-component system, probable response regulator PhcQ
MEQPFDYKQFAILYVDDEEKSLKYFGLAFEDQFRILTATNAREGLALLERQHAEIGLLMTDQRMPGEKGIWLLDRVRERYPRMVRILATAFADMDAAIAAVNTGAIYKYVTKPWDPPQLEATLKRGLELFALQRERDQLLAERMEVLRRQMAADRLLSLGLLASGLSHHIRNSLVSVKTFLEMAPGKLELEGVNPQRQRDPDFWQDFHREVQGQLERINLMLSELVSIAENPPRPFLERVRLGEVVDTVLALFEAELRSRKITHEAHIPADLPELTVDRPRFLRIIELLVRDELVSLPQGGRFSLSAALAEGGDEIVLTLSDNGPGLPEEVIRMVFNPFLLRADSPLDYGINLMSVYFLTHHHGGRIEARNEPGGGTTFTLHFPINAAALPPPPGMTTLNEAIWSKMLRTE